MTNFIYNNTTLPIDKINLGSLPPGANPRQWAQAAEWITVLQALLDVQAFCRGAAWLGIATNVADPVPSDVTNYLWLKTNGTLWKTVNGVATPIYSPSAEHLSGAGGGPATAISLDVGTSFLRNTVAETTRAFTLANGTVDGQVHHFASWGANNTTPCAVTVTSMDPTEAGDTVTVGNSGPSNFTVVWNATQAYWQILGTPRNATIA